MPQGPQSRNRGVVDLASWPALSSPRNVKTLSQSPELSCDTILRSVAATSVVVSLEHQAQEDELERPSSAYSSTAAAVESLFDPGSAIFGGPSGDAGTMTIELLFHDGDRGQLDVGAATESIAANPVPLPPAGWLLGVALLALPQRRVS